MAAPQDLKDGITPMMKQYCEIKDQYPDTLEFYRLGDFYEMFFDDAVKASRLLNLTLTHRGTNKGKPIPLAGVPFHAVDNYISRLIRMGESVVICEQIENKSNKKTKNFIRKVSRIVTPGTATDDGIAPDREDNLIACVYEGKHYFGISSLNLGSGAFKTTAVRDLKELSLALDKIAPAEIAFPEEFGHREIFSAYKSRKELPKWNFELKTCYELLCRQFHTQTLFGFGIENIEDGICAAGALLAYVRSTQSGPLEHIRSISRDDSGTLLLMDQTAQRNLELTSNLRGDFNGSLLSVLDRCITAMGSRRLRRMLLEPLRDNTKVNARLDLVEALIASDHNELDTLLDPIGDLERITARIGLGTARPKDLMVLREALKTIPALKQCLNSCESEILRNYSEHLNPMTDTCKLLCCAIKEVPSTFVRDGNVIADGYDQELDSLRTLMNGSASILADMEAKERAESGIATLKVGYNSVSGYYIEIPKSQSANVPSYYHRKQTLKNNERYITQELRELEEKTLTAQERSLVLEKELFEKLLTQLQKVLPTLATLADRLSLLDALLSLAKVADEYHYVRPELSQDSVIAISEGRHPVIETLTDKPFVANSVSMGVERMLVITGPNMGGKSTYMRQTALICIMARSGSFVPANSALIGDVDRIFTRIGASDDLVSGRSTFMVEMEEASAILNNATAKSLVLMDEIGRGTSAVEGAALAYAVAVHLCSRLRCLCLFSTHYSEIGSLEDNFPQVRNLCFKAEESHGKICFLYHVCPGSVGHSYAVEVGKLAGLPADVISMAKNTIAKTENTKLITGEVTQDLKQETSVLHPVPEDPGAKAVAELLKSADLNNLTPIQALNLLAKAKELLGAQA